MTNKVAFVVMSLSTGALLVACSPAVERQSDGAVASLAVSVLLDPGLTHVHGLHSTAAGTVLAGTHSGLFAIDPQTGATSRVGDSDDDFMGLAGVSGTDVLVSSGHPGPSSGAVNPLGLRASGDGGRTWVTRSLSGQSDLHVVATDGHTLIGSDALGLRISGDGGATWTPGAPVAVASLTVTPTAVWAVTPTGVQRSTDGGRSFIDARAPQLMLISGTSHGVWGIDAAGYAWFSANGTSWQKDDYVGPVNALTAAPDGAAYAVSDRMLYTLDRSDDNLG